jgi:cytochrome P450
MEADVLKGYVDLWRRYGDVVALRLGPLRACLIAHPEHVHHVLVKNQKNYVKGIGYDGLRLLLGHGLITSDGELWRRQRQLVQPAFTPAAVGQFFDMMVDVTRRMRERWQPQAAAGAEIEMDLEMRRLTMSVIGHAMFGIDLGEDSSRVGQALQSAFSHVPERASRPLRLPLAVPTARNRRFKQDLAVVDAFVAERIAEARQRGATGTLLDLLLRAHDEETRQPMTEVQLRDEVVTLFFAGFETTARSLTWAWYLLANHPPVAEALADEADRVLAGRDPTVADLHRLDTTRRVVDETLRLYPPTALLARQNVEADEVGGYSLPPKTLVILMPFLVHRFPGFWDEPERFDPDRFLPAAVERRPRSAYIPFASGPRVCVGNNFALMEMVLALAMTARRFRVTRDDPEPVPVQFVGVSRPARPIRLRLHARPSA